MKLICITPIDQIDGFNDLLKYKFEVEFYPCVSKSNLRNLLLKKDFEIIFTNPNQQGFIIDESLLSGTKISYICTASTGLNHIDTTYCQRTGIKVISITKELKTLKSITSTAELAFCLLLTSVRRVVPAYESVRKGAWSWQPYLGRQVKDLNIGVVGYGRLGTMFSNYALSFGSKVFVYDPFVKVSDTRVSQVDSLEEIFKVCDAVSLHVHVSAKTYHLIDQKIINCAKPNCVLINTSRGEIVDENAIFESLRDGKISHYACDVLEKEFASQITSPLFLLDSSKVTITPHIGGCSSDAQKIAYKRAYELLLQQTIDNTERK